MRKLTIVDRLLLAARELSEDSQSFAAEDLVVRAWELFPDHFGLQGYAEKYPDSNRVLTKIMGSKSPIRKRGLIRKVGTKRYQLTDVGCHAADALTLEEADSRRRLADMTRGLLSALKRMLRSSALRKFAEGTSLTFGDVSSFWNISPRSSAHQLADRTSEADAAIDLAIQHAEGGNEQVELPGDFAVGLGELRLLRELSDHIRTEFDADIQVIARRGDERRL